MCDAPAERSPKVREQAGRFRNPLVFAEAWTAPGIMEVPMADISTPRNKVELKTERPRLHKVILVNDDYTPREFVVTVLMAEFRMSEDQADHVMLTAHQRGVCVVAVYTADVAETKATRATDAGRAKGFPLLFTTEPEE
jgi:ATP-dependent Clp protease adaptor protein ClpS